MENKKENQKVPDMMQKLVSLSKRRGFVYPGSEIYGGLANTYDYGPLGIELLRNITNEWWDFFITKRPEMFGMDSSILMSPKVWEASGHTQRFNDALIDCKNCKLRTRADHLIENALPNEHVEGRTMDQLEEIITSNKIKCPSCGEVNWTKPRKFNLLFETHIGIVEEAMSLAYLRGEIAQGMFVNFKNVVESMRPRLPFGIGQFGSAFRNEITKGNFIFRTLEFKLAEFEYFFDSEKQDWKEVFEYWEGEMQKWIELMGVKHENLSWRTHTDEERSHYSTLTKDLEYKFPFGTKELFGLAYRTDFDLRNHIEKSGADLRFVDPEDNKRKIVPHVVEPTFGVNRIFLVILADAYCEEGERVILKLNPKLAPYKAAVFPLVANKEEIVGKAREVFKTLSAEMSAAFDARGNIGKRYYSQDEIGTPYCVTVDYQTIEDGTVTLRERDSAQQERVKVEDLKAKLKENLG